MLVGTGNVPPNSVYLCFWNKVSWFIKLWAIACRALMSVMEITVCCNVDIAVLVQRSPKQCAAKACWALLNEKLGTGTLE